MKNNELNSINAILHELKNELDYGFECELDESKGDDNEYVVTIKFTYNREFVKWVDFKVIGATLDIDGEYTADYFIEMHEDYYEEICFFDHTLKYLWIRIMEFPSEE